jgi:chemotaxis protein MotB
MPTDKGAKKVIVIKKPKKHGGGHHSSAWKVAYADFVTAMMAFFMVMWILGMDDKAKEAIEGYFSNPVGYKKGYSSGTSPLSTGNAPGKVEGPRSMRLIMRAHEHEQLETAAQKIRTKLREAAVLQSLAAQVEVIVTEQGLRVEIVEGLDGQTFFPLGSAEMKPSARALFEVIAAELSLLNNPLVIEGHTDSAMFVSAGYTNWELSADRANAARRMMERNGVAPSRIREVRGHADRDLRVTGDPLHPANRRITILLPFTDPELEVEVELERPAPPADGSA